MNGVVASSPIQFLIDAPIEANSVLGMMVALFWITLLVYWEGSGVNRDPSVGTRHGEVSIAWSLLGATATTVICCYLAWTLHFARDAQGGIVLVYMVLGLPMLIPLILALIWPLWEFLRQAWNYRNGYQHRRELVLGCVFPSLVLAASLVVVTPRVHRQYLYSVARSDETDPARIAHLYRRTVETQDRRLLRAIARNPNASALILNHLAEDVDPSVRLGVVLNPATPRNVVQRLLRDENKSVCAGARQRLGMP